MEMPVETESRPARSGLARANEVGRAFTPFGSVSYYGASLRAGA